MRILKQWSYIFRAASSPSFEECNFQTRACSHSSVRQATQHVCSCGRAHEADLLAAVHLTPAAKRLRFWSKSLASATQNPRLDLHSILPNTLSGRQVRHPYWFATCLRTKPGPDLSDVCQAHMSRLFVQSQPSAEGSLRVLKKPKLLRHVFHISSTSLCP